MDEEIWERSGRLIAGIKNSHCSSIFHAAPLVISAAVLTKTVHDRDLMLCADASWAQLILANYRFNQALGCPC